MVILGGLELVAAGYLINRHHKNKQEARRLQEEEEALEESRYRIYSPNNAGPGRRRSHSHDRHDRKRSHSHHRHHSHDRRHSRDDRRDDRKHNYERPPRESRPHASSGPPPAYAAAVPIAAQAVRPEQPPAMAPARPPVADPSFPPTGWPAHWEQSQRPSVTPQPQAAAMPPNLAPYYRDPAQSGVKYGFQDAEDDRGRARLSPSDVDRGADGHSRSRRGSSSRSVRFDVPSNRPQPGDETPPPYRP
jgi:hypothetical protein